MKIRSKIIGSLGLMTAVVLCILVVIMTVSGGRLRDNRDTIRDEIGDKIEANVKTELLALAADIGRYAVSIEAEIDKNMLTAARLLAEADSQSGGRLNLAELRRLKQVTGMSDLYLAGMDGVFTLSTEPGGAGVNLFDIWDGYRMLVTGESDYLPSAMKIKVETGEIFKFTAIPRYGGRGVLESALNAEEIERYLNDYIEDSGAIRSMNLFDFTFLTLTGYVSEGNNGVFTKGKTVSKDEKGYDEISGLFADASKISLVLDKSSAALYYPVLVDNAVRYVLFLDIDSSVFFETERLIETPLEKMLSESSALNRVLFFIVAALLAVFTLVISVMAGRLLSPLGFFSKLLAAFAEGDFSTEVPAAFLTKKDEMGDMAKSFNNTTKEMRDLVKVIREDAASLSGIGAGLADNMSNTAVSIHGITENIKGMRERTAEQAAGVSETGSSMQEIMQSINTLNGTISRQAESVAQSSSAIEEMLANIHSVAETLGKNAANTGALTQSAGVGRNDLQAVVADIQEIARESAGLLEINAVMENIASQTNLLSMNAAIEAAHAGEAGKGFAVVAGEIRKLAESASTQSKTISGVLKKIKASIDAITRSTTVAMERFDSIDREIHIVSGQEEQIRSAMEEQETGSKQILDAVSRMNEVTGLVQRESEAMALKGEKIIGESARLEEITEEITGGMTDMAAGADAINQAVMRINEISGENKRTIGTLSEAVRQFRV